MNNKLSLYLGLMLLCTLSAISGKSYAGFHLGLNLAFGGETKATRTTYYADGTSSDASVKTGDGYGLSLGYYFPVTDQFELLAAVGSLSKKLSASGETAEMSRTTVDIIGYFHMTPRFSLGLGMTRHNSPSFSYTGYPTEHYDDAQGFVFSLMYQTATWLYMEARSYNMDLKSEYGYSEDANAFLLGLGFKID